MGRYYVPTSKEVQRFIKSKLGDIKEVTFAMLVELSISLRTAELVGYDNEAHVWSTGPYEAFRQGIVYAREIMTTPYGNSEVFLFLSTLINAVAQSGYTVFDYTELGEVPLITVLCRNELTRPTKCTFKGEFKLTQPIPENHQKSCGKTIIDGTLLIDNGNRGRDIELPDTFTASSITRKGGWPRKPDATYDSVEAYINRPERVERLAKNRLIRELAKAANNSGVLTFQDNYGIPLEIGCIVACAMNNRAYLAKVVKQTTKRIVIQEFGQTSTREVGSSEVIRIK